MVTIQDVAREAGVSAMTVSHVLNDKPSVRPETRRLVREAIVKLDYRVNVAARNLRRGRTGTIGLAVPEVDRPYYGQLAARIIAAADRHGLRVAIEQTGAQRENELTALLTSRNRLYDGLILSTVGLGQADMDLLRIDHPVVLLGERIFDGPVDHVAMANRDGAHAAVSHLIEQGCRRIAMLGGAVDHQVDVAGLRREGWRSALEDAGLSVDRCPHIAVSPFDLAGGRQGVHDLVASGIPFDGIFCITDTVAIGALRGLADHGIHVPGAVKVVGFDDLTESAFTIPTLTSVDPDHEFMAETAVHRLVERIGGSTEAPRDFIGAANVVVRGSSESSA